jgi:membrane associated rhomboid family serine protease
LILACAAIFFVQVALHALAPQVERYIVPLFGLVPAEVLQGWIWQLVTYSFLHASLGHLLVNMLTLWMFGSQEESDWGSARFLEFYFFCVVGAALVTMAVAYAGWGLTPMTPTVGASGGIYGLLIAFGMLYGDREIFLFPFPFMIKAKYLVGILIFIVIIATFQPSQGGVANFAHLGGLLFGFLYIKFMPRRGAGFAASENTSAFAILTTAGSDAEPPRSSRFICGSTIERSRSTIAATTYRPTTRTKRMADRSRGG